MQQAFWVETEDWHTAGEPFRIVPTLPKDSFTHGLTVAEQRSEIIAQPDHPLDLLRRSLCHEPRGHADMYGGFIMPANDAGAHFGVLFWHRDGFSTACGHGTIALGAWAISKEVVKAVDGIAEVVIDVPSGRVTARAAVEDGNVHHIDFVNVESYQVAEKLPIEIVVDRQKISTSLDLGYGGALYASLDVANLDLAVKPQHNRLFVDIQGQIRAKLSSLMHLGKYDLYGVIFFEELANGPDAIEQRNVVVFTDGQTDRSPCGSGTAARVAMLLAEGKLSKSKRLIHHSIINTTFEAGIVSQAQGEGEYPVCVPYVRGNAHFVAHCRFWIDPAEPLYPGFLLR